LAGIFVWLGIILRLLPGNFWLVIQISSSYTGLRFT
jgi:hypothetical protein